MTDNEILQRIQKVYNEVMGRTDVVLKPGTRLIRSEEISSFVLMELIVAIEEEFDIELTYSVIRSMRTIRGLIKHIKNQN